MTLVSSDDDLDWEFASDSRLGQSTSAQGDFHGVPFPGRNAGFYSMWPKSFTQALIMCVPRA